MRFHRTHRTYSLPIAPDAVNCSHNTSYLQCNQRFSTISSVNSSIMIDTSLPFFLLALNFREDPEIKDYVKYL